MLRRIALLAIAAPRRIIAVAALVMVACGIFGIPVAKHLSAGGFQDPTSESAQATKMLADKFGQGDMELLITVTSADGAQAPATRSVGTDIAEQLKASPYVAEMNSAWTAHASAAPALISKDGKTGLIVAGITGGESEAQKHAKELTDRLVHDRDGVTVRAGGEVMTYVQINGQSEKDLLTMESIAIPLSFIVLVWVFGGLISAALPLAVGGFAILGSMAVLRAITLITDVSIFALNLTVAMGLALAIDYTLLIISRYRDELADGADRDDDGCADRSAVGAARRVARSPRYRPRHRRGRRPPHRQRFDHRRIPDRCHPPRADGADPRAAGEADRQRAPVDHRSGRLQRARRDGDRLGSTATSPCSSTGGGVPSTSG